jgi:hypothetical protein
VTFYVKHHDFVTGAVADSPNLTNEFYRVSEAVGNLDQNNIREGSIGYSTAVSPRFVFGEPQRTQRSTVQTNSGVLFLYSPGGAIPSATFTRSNKWEPSDKSLLLKTSVTASFMFMFQAEATRSVAATNKRLHVHSGLFINGLLCEELLISSTGFVSAGDIRIPLSSEGTLLLAPGNYTIRPHFKVVVETGDTYPDIVEVNIGAIGFIR